MIMFKHEKMRPQYFLVPLFLLLLMLLLYIGVKNSFLAPNFDASLSSSWKAYATYFTHFLECQRKHNVHTYMYTNKINIFHTLISNNNRMFNTFGAFSFRLFDSYFSYLGFRTSINASTWTYILNLYRNREWEGGGRERDDSSALI